MGIIIGADIVPTDANYDLFCDGNIDRLLDADIKDVLLSADYRIFNLEVPLTDRFNPIEKCGVNLAAPTHIVNGLKKMKINLVTMANNHILDQGESGLLSTCKILDEHSISYIGVGNSEKNAAKEHIFTFNNKKIGVYACAEHEFSIVSENSWGANPFDPLETPDHISNLKKMCDYVIVLYHGGKEYYPYPSPNLQKVCRKMAEKGADLIVCQHSHCLGCMEEYRGSTIVYGQGNFLFDNNNKFEFWNLGILIMINEDMSISYIPFERNRKQVQKLGLEILDQFYQRSEEIKKDGFVEKKYIDLSQEELTRYLYAFSGQRGNFLYRLLNRLTFNKFRNVYVDYKYKNKSRMIIENYVACETHRELFLTGIRMSKSKSRGK